MLKSKIFWKQFDVQWLSYIQTLDPAQVVFTLIKSTLKKNNNLIILIGTM